MAALDRQIILFSLILMRMSGVIFLNPIFGRRNIPSYFKAGLSMFLSVLLFSFFQESTVEVHHSIEYAVLLLKELAIGAVLGFTMELFFLVVTYAGAVMDFQMGLSMATVYDPQSNAQQAMTGSIWNAYMTLLFFAVNGHLALMRILVTSFQAVPPGEAAFTLPLLRAIPNLFAQSMELALRLAFPLIALEFLVEVAVGMLMKTIPQINIFVVNIQAKVLVGLGMLIFLFTPMSEFVNRLITTMMQTLQDILRLL